MYPALFGCIGASIDFDQLKPSYIGIGLGLYFFSMFVWFLASLVVGLCSRYTIWEILFIGFVWMPKGTVTATLGSVIYTSVITNVSPTHPKFEEYKQHGLLILITTILTVIISEPMGAAVIWTFSHWLLKKDGDAKMIERAMTIIEGNKESFFNAGDKGIQTDMTFIEFMKDHPDCYKFKV